jgi:hypothetical protein
VRAPTRSELLDYIAAMLCELRAMSARTHSPALTVLLELAYRKAVKERRAGQSGPAPGASDTS